MVAWYFYLVARPDSFGTIREEIKEDRARKLTLSDGEAAIIAARLAACAGDGWTVFDPELDIETLAKKLRLPAYRLSNYFNTRHGTSFPVWLNGLRVERALRLLTENPGRSILEIAAESGFGSKAAFNVQFKKIVGVSPSEFRRSGQARTRKAPERSME
jgi:AraC-like DNA-binding protein